MLDGKIAVVTGGSRGIGRAICEDFVRSGAQVAFLYQGNEEAAAACEASLRHLGGEGRAYRCDVSDYDQMCRTFAQILDDFGTVDIVVNNAGIVRDNLVVTMSPGDFNDVLDVNLKGAFHLIKLAYPVFLKKRSGRIINIGSVAGLMGNAGQANYAAAKAGLVGLTKSVARELARRGVTCNAILPGYIDTEMTAGTVGENLVERIPAKRAGTPSEVASLCTFLASGGAGYITGEAIRIDGGLAM